MTSLPQLRWRRDGEPSVTSCELRPMPESNAGFVEAGRYLFEKPGPGWLLRIDDEPIPDAVEPGCWLWSPRFFAGEVLAELVGKQHSVLFSIDVAPDPGKIGRDIFARMVHELWDVDPALVIGQEPATRHIGDLGPNENPWLAFARYRRYVPEFLQATAAIRARPRRSLRVQRIWTPLHQVRRVDRRTATALSSSPAAALLVGGSEARGVLSGEQRLDVPLVEETLDSAANRAMLALALALLRRGRALHDQLQMLVQREVESETETPLASRWPVRSQVLVELASALKLLLRLSPFADAQRPEITAAGLTAVAADPAYSRAWNRGWRALRRGVESPPTAERLWMSPSWQIYERWCLLRLGRLLTRATPDWHWRLDATALRWTGAWGTARCFLEYQRTFRSMAEGPTARRSISRQREPDLLLSVMGSDGSDLRFVVFDAKYRASRANVLDAMASAHIYHDSLRIGLRRPEAAFLLVPSGGGTPWLEDAIFQAEHGVGVLPLSLDVDTALPAVVLDQFRV